MIEAVFWMAGGSLLTLTALIFYAAWHGLSDKEKDGLHRKWQGR
jgi:uncharacterized membrane protein